MSNPILVIGATGRHGNTGEYLVARLREEGRVVRVLARTRSERTERLEELGAEVVLGDLHDRRSLLPALADVDLAYFAYPIAAGVVDAAANYGAAVREMGRFPRTVVMSMGPAQKDHPSDLGKAQWLAEQIMEWAGLDLQILRVSALFHQNLQVLHAPSIRREHRFRNSFGSVKMAWISGQDAAELGVVALLHPERFTESVVWPQGSELLSHYDVADMLTDVLGETITFEPVTKHQWRQELIDLSSQDGETVVNSSMAQHISSIGHAVSVQGATSLPADPDALRALIGREPISLRDYLSNHRNDFATNGSAAGTSATSTAGVHGE
ncbi:NmrA family NAD(P)-binding protein [Mycobacterium sp. NAZ190054]|uniref:NmrA family NAD(P)-binding protein n=1 Tax=Mycobacterium sp. NAZ190054 TaxID=1747766 RepID=UPI00079B5355|nr:NmrA family NAD(P)-binding protein [Mycobacterium sp. NAZ190054]KWX68516.1 NmrA family transcriptional regulator [Mycobacterium sp. NAZ190054]